MISTKPYLMRAIYEWCTDQGFTPYMQVAVDGRTRVPAEHVRDGQIVLNIGQEATHQLMIGNDLITFQARFNGRAFPISVPVDCVAAIYARENGQGMAFEVEPEAHSAAGDTSGEASIESDAPVQEAPAGDDGKPRSHLTRVK
ncbi:ClpXP protease specificity-enhancing factor [Denitratisoma sp. agr-D3]